MPRYQSETQSAIQQEAEEEIRLQTLLRQQYNRMFGGQQPPSYGPHWTPPPEDNHGPLLRTLGKYGFVRAA